MKILEENTEANLCVFCLGKRYDTKTVIHKGKTDKLDFSTLGTSVLQKILLRECKHATKCENICKSHI